MTKQYKPGDKLTKLKELVDYLSESSERRAENVDGISYRMANGFLEFYPGNGWVRTGLDLSDFPFTVLPDAEPEKRYLKDINELKAGMTVRVYYPLGYIAEFSFYFESQDNCYGYFTAVSAALSNGWKVEVLEMKEV